MRSPRAAVDTACRRRDRPSRSTRSRCRLRSRKSPRTPAGMPQAIAGRKWPLGFGGPAPCTWSLFLPQSGACERGQSVTTYPHSRVTRGTSHGNVRNDGRDALDVAGRIGRQAKGEARNRQAHAAVRAALFLASRAVPLVVIVDAVAGIVNPLIFRDIINNGILKGNIHLIVRMSILAGVIGFSDAALGVGQSFLSSTIGARIVLSLRAKLFAHIQQMPLAFFTRAQTGALVSRLNTDVSGAQSAFTDILSNVVGNLISVILLLGAMFALSWQITLAALVLVPIFVFPARFWGRKLQAITRETYGLVAEMNSLMVERFNV